MNIICPMCGRVGETDEIIEEGTEVECPFCGRVYTFKKLYCKPIQKQVVRADGQAVNGTHEKRVRDVADKAVHDIATEASMISRKDHEQIKNADLEEKRKQAHGKAREGVAAWEAGCAKCNALMAQFPFLKNKYAKLGVLCALAFILIAGLKNFFTTSGTVEKSVPPKVVLAGTSSPSKVKQNYQLNGFHLCGVYFGQHVSSLPISRLELNSENNTYTFGDALYSEFETTRKLPNGETVPDVVYLTTSHFEVHYTPTEQNRGFLKDVLDAGGRKLLPLSKCKMDILYNSWDRRICGLHWRLDCLTASQAVANIERIFDNLYSVPGLKCVLPPGLGREIRDYSAYEGQHYSVSENDFARFHYGDTDDLLMITLSVHEVSRGQRNGYAINVDIQCDEIGRTDGDPQFEVESQNPNMPLKSCAFEKKFPPKHSCHLCGGLGYTEEKVECEECKGTGRTLCAVCKRKNWIKNDAHCLECVKVRNDTGYYCHECHGSGTATEKVQCTRCGGSREDPSGI